MHQWSLAAVKIRSLHAFRCAKKQNILHIYIWAMYACTNPFLPGITAWGMGAGAGNKLLPSSKAPQALCAGIQAGCAQLSVLEAARTGLVPGHCWHSHR